MGKNNVRLLVNRVRPRVFKKVSGTIDNIIDASSVQLLGVVEEDPSVIVSANLNIPLVLYSRKGAAMQFLHIARRIDGKPCRLGKIRGR